MKDPIERQDVLNLLDSVYQYMGNWLVQYIEEGISSIPSAQPETEERTAESAQNVPNDELISKKAAIDALAKMMPSLMSADGSHPADEEIFKAQEIFADCIKAIEILPSAQPYSEADIQKIQDLEQAQIEKAYELGKLEAEHRWIPCSELPSDNREVEVTCEVRRCGGKRYRYTCHASYVHKYTIESTDYCDWEEADEYNEDEDKYYALPGWYERVHNWDDYSFIVIADFVTAWRELPEPYREEGE